MTPARFFASRPRAFALFSIVEDMVRGLGSSSMRVTRSQIAFARRRAFAWVWTPDRWLRSGDVAPLVLSLALARRDPDRRWKSVVDVAPGRVMHHLEVRAAEDADEFVRSCLYEAWLLAA